MEERCVCCGEIIPEGRMVCPICEGKCAGKDGCSDAGVRKKEMIDQ